MGVHSPAPTPPPATPGPRQALGNQRVAHGAFLNLDELDIFLHLMNMSTTDDLAENGGDKLVHGSGGISQPRAE